MRRGEVRGLGVARDVGPPRPVDGDPLAEVVARPAQEGRVRERPARGVELRHEGVGATDAVVVAGVERSRRGGIARGERVAGDVGAARPVDGDPARLVVGRSAQVRRVGERRARGVELRDEDVPAAVVAGVERPRRGRIVRRGAIAGDVRVTGSVQRERGGRVEGRAADEGRVRKRRARGIELRHEGVDAAVVGRVERPRRWWGSSWSRRRRRRTRRPCRRPRSRCRGRRTRWC